MLDKRRQQRRDDPAWCPKVERRETAEAAKRQEEDQRRQEAGAVTVATYAERWLATHVAQHCRERTARLYQSTFEQHIIPALGTVPLAELTRARIKAFLAAKALEPAQVRGRRSTKQQDGGVPTKPSPLTRGTLKNLIVPLRAMLNEAFEEGLITGTPAAKLWKRVRGRTEQEARKVTALAAAELRAVLDAADQVRPEHADAVYCLAWTGLRLSECCGLQWGDVDLHGSFLEVRRTASHRERRVLLGPRSRARPGASRSCRNSWSGWRGGGASARPRPPWSAAPSTPPRGCSRRRRTTPSR